MPRRLWSQAVRAGRKQGPWLHVRGEESCCLGKGSPATRESQPGAAAGPIERPVTSFLLLFLLWPKVGDVGTLSQATTLLTFPPVLHSEMPEPVSPGRWPHLTVSRVQAPLPAARLWEPCFLLWSLSPLIMSWPSLLPAPSAYFLSPLLPIFLSPQRKTLPNVCIL